MIELVIDNRETKIVQHYKTIGDSINFSLKNLDIGDFIYYKSTHKCPLILIERKSLDDLASSIKDGRYREQKIRIKKFMQLEENKLCKVIYIIEGEIDHNYFNGIPSNTLYSSIVNTFLRDDFYIVRTKDIDETVVYLTKIYEKLSEYGNKYLPIQEESKDELEDEKLEYCASLSVKKKANMTHDVCFITQLSQIPGVSTIIAATIVEKYNNMKDLVINYEKFVNEKEKETLLRDLIIGHSKTKSTNTRKIGKVISARVYNYIYGIESNISEKKTKKSVRKSVTQSNKELDDMVMNKLFH